MREGSRRIAEMGGRIRSGLQRMASRSRVSIVDIRRGVLTRTLVFAGAATAMCLAMIVPPARRVIEEIDAAWQATMFDAEWGPLLAVAHVLGFVGGVWGTTTLRVAIGGWAFLRRRWWVLGAWIGSIVVAEGANSILKALYGRTRPPDPLEVTRSSSFPSGHTIAAAVTVVMVVVLFAPRDDGRRRWWAAAIGLILAMALSRTYLRVHWLSDVVAGALIGSASGLLVAEVDEAVRRRRVGSPAAAPSAGRAAPATEGVAGGD